jgi:hypothetical protein
VTPDDLSPAQAPLLAWRWPVFAGELRWALRRHGRWSLARQVDALRVVSSCGCGDGFCQSFHTVPEQPGPYGPGHRNLTLRAPWRGYLVLDVIQDQIVFVEILYRAPLT